LSYKFMPDHRLEPRDFVVALTVFYHDGTGQYFSNTFFNQTIEIVEIKKIFDYELISMFMILAGIAAGIGEWDACMGRDSVLLFHSRRQCHASVSSLANLA